MEIRLQTISRGHFQRKLADRAKRDEFAAPLTHGGLSQKLDYLPRPQLRQVQLAYQLAEKAHRGQQRRTGHSYITHPLAVADILAEMRMDHQSIMAALLHDVLEDCNVDKQSLAGEFGEDVANIVDGVSKLSRIFESRDEAQAENFRKMALATSRDLRVILVKLADRLHNMRTIGVMRFEARRRIARETLDLYAPIANRLGMHRMKIELEDLAFEALYPLRSDRLRGAIDTDRKKRRAQLAHAHAAVQASLKREGIDAEVISHQRHLYAVYKKMKQGRKPFADVMQVFGFRIVVDQVDTCYRALGVMHSLYKPMVRQFKDYIAIPKTNGYQSLHTTLFGEGGVPLEIQIRTRQMEAIANHGIAGNWLYRESTPAPSSDTRVREWIGSILDLQRKAGNSQEFLENLKIDLFPDSVFVFTPRGEVITLPTGSCPIDFAYAIHTDVGNRCTGCKVNRVPVPLSHKLDSGETVEISLNKSAQPDPTWLSFAVSAKARSGILDALKHRSDHESRLQGIKLLNRVLSSTGTSIRELDFRRLRKVFREFNVRKRDDLFVEIGKGNLMAFTVAQRLLAANEADYEPLNIDAAGPISIHGSEGLVISYGRCCGPVPGDSIVGHVSPGKGLVVHIATCANAKSIAANTDVEVIPTRWANVTHGEFDAFLRVSIRRLKGALAELAATLNKVDVGINDFTVEERSGLLSLVSIELSIRDLAHLNRAIQRLRSISVVEKVDRRIG